MSDLARLGHRRARLDAAHCAARAERRGQALGFLIASVFITAVTTGYSLAKYNKSVVPALVAPIKDLRSWAFIFCFLSIGLTTRFRNLASMGKKPFLAFSTGAVVNVIIGLVLSAIVFAAHWENLAR